MVTADILKILIKSNLNHAIWTKLFFYLKHQSFSPSRYACWIILLKQYFIQLCKLWVKICIWTILRMASDSATPNLQEMNLVLRHTNIVTLCHHLHWFNLGALSATKRPAIRSSTVPSKNFTEITPEIKF